MTAPVHAEPNLDLGVIGNAAAAALVDRIGRIVWYCVPRMDGDPVFCRILLGDKAEELGGAFAIELVDLAESRQSYRRNTAVLETVLTDGRGNSVRIIDFAPRYKRFGRIFRPMTIVRRIEPIAGTPRIRVRLQPRYDYGAGTPSTTRGSNHIRYICGAEVLRLTTDAPVGLVAEAVPFVLDRPLSFILGPDETLPEAPNDVSRGFLESTIDYWIDWVRYLSVPFDFQEAVIRAAITLKLCSHEETGAVVAALTTSIPEFGASGRTWDYRFCWLRDTFFIVQALNRLGATKTMEDYLGYVTNLVAGSPDGYLQPLFGLSFERTPQEWVAPALPGYRGYGPVRLGNAAYTQVQNDGYGSVIMAITQSFFDERLPVPGDEALFRRLEPLGHQAEQRWDVPDAGLWEFRSRTSIHTHSALMCWAACDRLARIALRLKLSGEAAYWSASAHKIRNAILERAWNDRLNSFSSTFDGADVDASLLLLPEIGLITADDPRFLGTVAHVEAMLRSGDHLFRYRAPDDFGEPETAFTVCTFWLVEALERVGRRDEARAVFEGLLARRNHLGLLSEGLHTETGELWGNFPQAYSMVGLVSAAMRLSRRWEDAF